MTQLLDFYPTVQYDITGEFPTETTTAVDIFVRQQLSTEIKKKAVNFYPYTVLDGERPDHIAYSYYGDVKYTWLIFFANNIVNPFNEWPMSIKQFNEYIEDKYGSISSSQATVHHYEQILRDSTSTLAGTTTSKEVTIEVDLATYLTLATTKRKEVSNFTYEQELNEAKRNIRLIEDVYVEKVFKAARNVTV